MLCPRLFCCCTSLLPLLPQGLNLPGLVGVMLAAAWPIYSCCESALVMSIVMMSRMSLTGHVFVGLGGRKSPAANSQ